MARRVNQKGETIVTELKDLKRGDKVCVSYWGGKYINTIVTRVRTVECATIITVKKVQDCPNSRFVGYHTSRIAVADSRTVLTLDTYWADVIEENLKSADNRSKTIITRAKALRAMMDLKTWFFAKEEEYRDQDPE